MRSYKIEAIVIRRRNFLEKDRILVLFSKEKGKIEALAKGARRPGSRLSYASDLGTVAHFYLHQGRSLDYIIEIKPLYHPVGARGKFEKTEKLGFLFKIVDALFEQREPHPKTYQILKETNEGISSKNFQLIFLSFLLHLVDDLGLRPELFDCVVCRKKIAKSDELVFSPKEGVAHKTCGPQEAIPCETITIKLIRLIISRPFKLVSKAKVEPRVFINAYKIVRLYLEWHFGKILPEKIL